MLFFLNQPRERWPFLMDQKYGMERKKTDTRYSQLGVVLAVKKILLEAGEKRMAWIGFTGAKSPEPAKEEESSGKDEAQPDLAGNQSRGGFKDGGTSHTT
ncbi:hypothetical protein M758_UG030200 [Ceratodon purpureus]|nr:hypothetical protein M758_UG030200 [Ceratodon purpureus]